MMYFACVDSCLKIMLTTCLLAVIHWTLNLLPTICILKYLTYCFNIGYVNVVSVTLVYIMRFSHFFYVGLGL